MGSKITIIGGGLSGVFAAQALSHYDITIFEPNDIGGSHSAILRTRDKRFAEMINAEPSPVKVIKAIWKDGEFVNLTPAIANEYSRKVTGKLEYRSICNVDPVDRYVLDSDWARRCMTYLERHTNVIREFVDSKKLFELIEKDTNGPVISTIPLPALLGLMTDIGFDFDLDKDDFDFRPVYTSNVDLGESVNLHQTVYIPQENIPMYRLSISGRNLIAEGSSQFFIEEYAKIINHIFGIDINFRSCKRSKLPFGKMVPVDDVARKELLAYLTRRFNIYSFGRYACWKPKLMLDDLVDDIGWISKHITNKGYVTSY